jgi:hypothetical protein
MMTSTCTCCALTRLDPIILNVPSVACWVGWPGGGSVVDPDWAYVVRKKRERMYSEDEKVPIDTGKERKERKKGVETKKQARTVRHALNRLQRTHSEDMSVSTKKEPRNLSRHESDPTKVWTSSSANFSFVPRSTFNNLWFPTTFSKKKIDVHCQSRWSASRAITRSITADHRLNPFGMIF